MKPIVFVCVCVLYGMLKEPSPTPVLFLGSQQGGQMLNKLKGIERQCGLIWFIAKS